jgi:hypothetical protein
MKQLMFWAILAPTVIVVEQAHAQVLTTDRCPNAPSTTSGVAQARYAWGLWCRAHPLNSSPGVPFTPDHYLSAASVSDYNANPSQQPFLYPTYFDQSSFTKWDLPNAPGTDCTLLPATAFNVGLCIAGCYVENTPLQFADGTMGIKAAAEAGKLDLVTLSPNATLDSLDFVNNTVEHYTTDIREDWQTIFTLQMKSGGQLRVTNEHPLITSDGVMHQAQALRVGDSLVRANGRPDRIVHIATHKMFGKVYNVKPVTTDYTSNIVVAGGYLNGSQRFQNEFLNMVNSLILRRALTDQAEQLAGK